MARVHSQIRPTKCLGLTATPYRTDRLKLCFRNVIRDAGIQQLIQDGYLARYHHFTIPRYAPVEVAEFYVSQRQRWGKSLIFFFRTDDCFACQRALADAGVAAEVVTGTSNRERQLEDFEADRVNVLISMAVLTEGFDCPALKTVFCRPSGKGCTVQMAGRVFRRHPQVPHKQLVQCRDTRHPFMKTATPDEQYAWMDGGWRTMKLNQQLATMTTNTLRVMAACDVRLPEEVANHRPRKRLFNKPPQL
jgi:superfamily II DNA or RNA helicase